MPAVALHGATSGAAAKEAASLKAGGVLCFAAGGKAQAALRKAGAAAVRVVGRGPALAGVKTLPAGPAPDAEARRRCTLAKAAAAAPDAQRAKAERRVAVALASDDSGGGLSPVRD